MSKSNLRSTKFEVDLAAFRHNYKKIHSLLHKNCQIMAVVKGDAYSHGVKKIVEELNVLGCQWLAVATIDEAIELREIGVKCNIFLLSPPQISYTEAVINNNISLSLTDMAFATFASKVATKLQKTVKFHLAIDTGLSREGFLLSELNNVSDILSHLNGIEIIGVFSHLATANEDSQEYSYLQYKKFKLCLEKLKSLGIDPPLKHICNSSATIKHPQMHLNAVRIGSALYGLNRKHLSSYIELKDVCAVKSTINLIREIPQEHGVGYGLTYITRGRERLGLVPIGYRDGYTRLLANKSEVIIKGQKSPLVGSIGMDQCFVNLTKIEGVQVSDEVVLIGSQGEEYISPDSLATLIGTSPHEIINMISDRVPRVYINC